MSKRLSFEEIFKHKMKELPLPDEDQAWQKMKLLLDKKKKKKPFFFFRNEKLAGGIMLMLLLGFWLMIAPEKTQQQANTAKAMKNVHKDRKIKQRATRETKENHSSTDEITVNEKDSFANPLLSGQLQKNRELISSRANRSEYKNEEENVGGKLFAVRANPSSALAFNNKNWIRNNEPERSNQSEKKDSSTETMTHAFFKSDNQFSKANDSSESFVANNKSDDSSHIVNEKKNNSEVVAKDSLQHITASYNKATSTTKKLVTIKKPNAYFIDAGIELKQQLPVNNQKLTYYNYNGNQALFPDYIPSVYLKIEKEKKWFLQGELSYASPRLPKDFVYQQKTKADYAHGSITATTYRLQKIYYTQVPVSFNVHVHSSWSVGAGAMYSWLRGAVAKQETATGIVPFDLQTVTEERLPVKGFTDSFLYKTQTSLLLQAAYEKNKWSFGLRYLQDVQPFITYTLPGGEKKDKLNSSLEFLIRYRLFRSSNFSLKTNSSIAR